MATVNDGTQSLQNPTLTPDRVDEVSEEWQFDLDGQVASHHHFQREAILSEDYIGMRIDQAAADVFSEFSREKIKEWLASGQLLVNGKQIKAKNRVLGQEVLVLDVVLENKARVEPEDIPLDILYEDDYLMVVNKPRGMVVHPGAGNYRGTLVNALLYHSKDLAQLPRAGLVHRIDKETSGLLVVAKTLPVQLDLSKQLQEKTVYRKYDAVVVGNVISGGTVDAPIGRHPKDRVRMAVVSGGRAAVTHYRVAERFDGYTLIKAELETGRTHQIRVHLAHIGHALLGDPLYNVRQPNQLMNPVRRDMILNTHFQALHAHTLGLTHPKTGQHLEVVAPWPSDFAHVVDVLRNTMIVPET